MALGEYRFGRGLFIMARYEYRVPQAATTKLCDRTEGSDWPTVAERLNRFGHRELEVYRPKDTTG